MQALITFDDTFDAETILEAFQDAAGVVKVEIVHEHCGKCARLDINYCQAHPPTPAAQNLPLDCQGVPVDSERGKLSGVR